MEQLKMVDLNAQYESIKSEIDAAVFDTISKGDFINGEAVRLFALELALFLDVKHVIPCANGTDALQLALMALNLPKGSEIIVPSFCYIAAAEVIAFLGYEVVFVDVDEGSFNIKTEDLEVLITEKTKAIIPVHLFGQSCNMLPIIKLCQKYNLYIIEDNAQSLGAMYTFPDGAGKMVGTIGHIGTTSFFPSKNLGCMGDGGAVFTNDDALAEKMKMMANHGQKKKYHHEILGINSRLDTLQAAILRVKLKRLASFNNSRHNVADLYSQYLNENPLIVIPEKSVFSSHVYHQYTLRVKNDKRDALKKHLETRSVPNMIYYPLPLHKQEVFKLQHHLCFPVSERLSKTVLSLPIYPELNEEQLFFICDAISKFGINN